MIFNDKLAKLGMANTISCRQIKEDELEVYICGQQTIVKTLKQQDKDYQLSGTQRQYNYNQIVGIKPGYLLARIDNLISIIKENDGD